MSQDAIIAAAAFILLAATIFAYVLSLVLPARHYPRFFALIIGLATVPFLAMLKVPGAWEAFEVLLYSAIPTGWPIWLFVIERSRTWFFSSPQIENPTSTSPALAPYARYLVIGLLLGILVAGFFVSALMPAGTKETLDEIGKSPSGSARNVHINVSSGLRVADGAIYIGVYSTNYGMSCSVNVNSDKSDNIKNEFMRPGEAIVVPSSQNKYRVVLTSIKFGGCIFDIIRDEH
jgi:hypothetical protein